MPSQALCLPICLMDLLISTLPFGVTVMPRVTLVINLLPWGPQYGAHVLGWGGVRPFHLAVDRPLLPHTGVFLQQAEQYCPSSDTQGAPAGTLGKERGQASRVKQHDSLCTLLPPLVPHLSPSLN